MNEDFIHDEVIVTSSNETGSQAIIRRVVFPSFEIYQNPSIRINDIKRRRFPIIDRAVQKARQEIMGQEDAAIFAALDAAGVSDD